MRDLHLRSTRSSARLALFRTFRMIFPAVLIALSVSGVGHAQSSEVSPIFEIDPAIALNGFAILAAAIVVLFEFFRSRA